MLPRLGIVPPLFIGLSACACSAEIPYPMVDTVQITPSDSIAVLGDTIQFTAQAFDRKGRLIANVTRAIVLADRTVLGLAEGGPGLVKAIGVGKAEVRVTAGSASAAATVTVTCPKAAGRSFHEGTIAKSEVWSAADSPHRVTGDVLIRGIESDGSAVSVVIESCARVEVAKGVVITVGDNREGVLRAEGTDTKEGPSGVVTFAPDDPSAGPGHWVGIVFNGQQANSNGPTSLLRHTLVSKAGGKGKQPLQAAITVLGAEGTASAPDLDSTIIQASAGYGLVLTEHAGLGLDSRNLNVSGAALAAAHSPPDQAGTVPDGTFVDNGANEIYVTGGTMTRAQSWTVKSVPYHVLGDLAISSWPGRDVVAAFLTLGGGATVKLARGARLAVATVPGDVGGIYTGGTPSEPVTFTSAEAAPAPGDWVGVVLGRGLDARSSLIHTRISFAGGPSGFVGIDGDYQHPDNGSLIFLRSPPQSFLLQNSTVEKSAGYGIVRGFNAGTGPSFVGHAGTMPPNLSISPERANTFDEKTLAFGKESPPNPLVLESRRCAGGICQAMLTDGDKIKPEMLCGPTGKLPPLSWRFDRADTKPYTDLIQSYALLVKQEYPVRSLHWFLSNVSSATTSLEEGASPGGTLPAGAKESGPYNAACPQTPAECRQVRDDCSNRDKACSNYFACVQTLQDCTGPESQCHLLGCDRTKLNTLCAWPTYSFELRALNTPSVDLGGATTLEEIEAKLLATTLGAATIRVSYQQ